MGSWCFCSWRWSWMRSWWYGSRLPGEKNISMWGRKGDSGLRLGRDQRTVSGDRIRWKTRYPGEPGILIARIGDRFYIDTSVVNNLILGITRSGKGGIACKNQYRDFTAGRCISPVWSSTIRNWSIIKCLFRY